MEPEPRQERRDNRSLCERTRTKARPHRGTWRPAQVPLVHLQRERGGALRPSGVRAERGTRLESGLRLHRGALAGLNWKRHLAAGNEAPTANNKIS